MDLQRTIQCDLLAPLAAAPGQIKFPALVDPIKFITQVIGRPQISRPCVSFKVFCSGRSPAQAAQLTTGRSVSNFLVCLRA